MHSRMHARTHAHTHTHTHTVQTNRGEGQCCLTEIFWEEKCLEFAFEGRERVVECLVYTCFVSYSGWLCTHALFQSWDDFLHLLLGNLDDYVHMFVSWYTLFQILDDHVYTMYCIWFLMTVYTCVVSDFGWLLTHVFQILMTTRVVSDPGWLCTHGAVSQVSAVRRHALQPTWQWWWPGWSMTVTASQSLHFHSYLVAMMMTDDIVIFTVFSFSFLPDHYDHHNHFTLIPTQ